MSTGYNTANESSHTCQRCRQPLLPDPSIAALDPSTHALITSALPGPSSSKTTQDASARLAALPPTSRQGAAVWANANGIPYDPRGPGIAESFVLLSDSISPSIYRPQARPSHSQGHSHPDPRGHHAVEAPSSSSKSASSQPNVPLPPSRLADNLHAILSDRTNITHPLCAECTGLLQAELQKQLEELTRERDAYIAFERGILRNRDERVRKSARSGSRTRSGAKGKERAPDAAYDSLSDSGPEGLDEDGLEGTESEWEELQRQRAQLEQEEADLLRKLAEREKELEQAREDEERIAREEEAVDQAETEFLYAHAERSTDVARKQAALQTAKTHLLLSQSLLHHLEHVNVWNDAFHIGLVPLSGPGEASGSAGAGRSRGEMGGSAAGGAGYEDADRSVGTINGLRLGGRPIVEWEEINAAWGLVALCIDRLAAKLNLTFETYKIVPLGSNSRIEELPPKRDQYELYASGDLTAILQKRRFSTGLVALLDCIRQMLEHGKKHNKKWAIGKPEYRIHKDKINGLSIRLPGLSSASLLPSMSLMGLGASTFSPSPANPGSRSGDGAGEAVAASGEELWNRSCRLVLEVLKRILMRESEADRPGTVS